MARFRSVASLFAVQLPRAAVLALACSAHGAQAADKAQPHVEVWSGGEAFQQFWSIYAGAGVAPFGSVREDGFRVRGVAGYSDYDGGMVSFADLLLGYRAQLGPVTLKVFAGLTGADRVSDELLRERWGTEIGGKGVVEAWWNVSDRVWTSADLSWGWTSDAMTWNSMHSVYNGRVRLGRRLSPVFSAGLEGGAAGASLEEGSADGVDRDIARLGGFVRYEWATGELSVSGGLAVDRLNSHWGPLGPFGTVSVLTRF